MRASNRSRLVPALAVVTAALAGAACESRSYLYEPAVASSATVAGRAASHYRIPPEAPRGDVRVASFGLVDIEPSDELGRRMRFDDELRAIHVRLVVANNSDAAWWVDTRDVRAVLPSNGESRAAFARVDEGSPPIVHVPPGEERTVDLFFPLPEHMQDASELPSFETIWSVQMPNLTIAERTPFERIDVAPATSYPQHYRWGPPYYYDPLYGRGAFIGVRIGRAWVERPVVIERHVTPPAPSAPPGRRVR